MQTGPSTGLGHAQHADFAVAQFNGTTGALDPNFFNGQGEAVSINDNNVVGLAGSSDLLYMPDGKIVAAGGVEDPTNSNNADFASIRFNTDGSFDTTFGPDNNGIVITDFDQHSDGAFGIRLQTWDNKVYEVGHTKTSGTSGLVALVRYTPDGPAVPTLSIGNATVTEGNSGSTTANFTVTLANLLAGTVTVDYTTQDGTATVSDNDYASTSGTLTFAGGVTSLSIPVTVFGDTKVDPDETFSVVLSNATTGITIGTSTGTGTILNDDSSVVNNNPLIVKTVTLSKPPSPLIAGAKERDRHGHSRAEQQFSQDDPGQCRDHALSLDRQNPLYQGRQGDRQHERNQDQSHGSQEQHANQSLILDPGFSSSGKLFNPRGRNRNRRNQRPQRFPGRQHNAQRGETIGHSRRHDDQTPRDSHPSRRQSDSHFPSEEYRHLRRVRTDQF